MLLAAARNRVDERRTTHAARRVENLVVLEAASRRGDYASWAYGGQSSRISSKRPKLQKTTSNFEFANSRSMHRRTSTLTPSYQGATTASPNRHRPTMRRLA